MMMSQSIHKTETKDIQIVVLDIIRRKSFDKIVLLAVAIENRRALKMHIDVWLLWLPLLSWVQEPTSAVYPTPWQVEEDMDKPLLRLGAVLPSNRFLRRHLMSAISYPLLNDVIQNPDYSILGEEYRVKIRGSSIKEEMIAEMFLDAKDPATVYQYLCEELLDKQVNTLLFLRDDDSTGITAPTTNFIMKFANSIGIPVIAWIGDNSGLAQTSADSIVIQMTPSVTHQCTAMFELLKRYKWYAFTIMTGSLAGQDHFINTLRDMVDQPENKDLKFEVLSVIRITSEVKSVIEKELHKITQTESRVILLYASSKEASIILGVAEEMGLTDAEFVWIASKSVVSGTTRLPAGLLGVDFENTEESDEEEKTKVLKLTVKMWANGMKEMLEESRRTNRNISLVPDFQCDRPTNTVWKAGVELYNKMINVSMDYGDDLHLEFNRDGTMKYTSLSIMNLVPTDEKKKEWKKIGHWKTSSGLQIEAIFWPGDTPLPPQGRPPKYHLKVVTLKEVPYVIYSDPDPNTGQCSSQSFLCRIAPLDETKKYNDSTTNPELYQCCSGFCMDLLNLLAEDIGFDFELFEVEDKLWGAPNDQGEWVGLVKVLQDHKADMAMTSLKITPERNEAVDFSVPFLETGITIIVAVRDGVITPTAFLKPFDRLSWIFILLMCIQVLAVAVFLFEWMSPNGFNLQKNPPREPYDYPSWCLILVFSVHACGAAIFIFEWLSPSGLERGTKPIREHKFSLFRSFWLIWAMLFGAAVNVDNPRGVSSRFLANIWALFAVVFTASYTANLATFMITKDDYDRLTGINDTKLQNADQLKPPYKFGTIPKGSTDVNLKNNFPKMWAYMNKMNTSTRDVTQGVKDLKDGELNAFIYDATVLEYKASHDDNCKLKTVGSWYAMTGYGVAFPKSSKWLPRINHVLRRLQFEGTLERLQKFWLAGACKYKSDEEAQSKSIPLGILNFTSAFILLASGMLLGGLLLLLEHIYFKCFRARLRKIDKCGCCGLISLSMGKSLTFEQSVREAIELQKHHKCKNPVCETHTWKIKHELDLALLKVERLNKQLSDNGLAPDRRAVWKRPQPGSLSNANPPAIGWKNEIIPNHRNTASPPTTLRNLHNRATSPGYNKFDTGYLPPGGLCEHNNRLGTPPRNIMPPSTPPSAWQQQPKTFDYPPQPHSLAGVQPESTLPYQQTPPEPYYCTPIRQPPPKQPEQNKKGSKSLPSSPVKRQRSFGACGGGGSGSEREDSPSRYQQENSDNMTRTTSFAESPRRRTRVHQGNMYVAVNKSEPHICEKETVL